MSYILPKDGQPWQRITLDDAGFDPARLAATIACADIHETPGRAICTRIWKTAISNHRPTTRSSGRSARSAAPTAWSSAAGAWSLPRAILDRPITHSVSLKVILPFAPVSPSITVYSASLLRPGAKPSMMAASTARRTAHHQVASADQYVGMGRHALLQSRRDRPQSQPGDGRA